MTKIKKIGKVELCYPQILIKQSNCENGKSLHIVEAIDKMILKIDELVEEVNKLKRE